jgi:maltose O-acetyltransferase
MDAKTRVANYVYGEPITIGNNVWFGGHCVVLSGVTIGDNAVIGAGSVVTKDIPAGAVAAGNPARVLRYLSPEDQKA